MEDQDWLYVVIKEAAAELTSGDGCSNILIRDRSNFMSESADIEFALKGPLSVYMYYVKSLHDFQIIQELKNKPESVPAFKRAVKEVSKDLWLDKPMDSELDPLPGHVHMSRHLYSAFPALPMLESVLEKYWGECKKPLQPEPKKKKSGPLTLKDAINSLIDNINYNPLNDDPTIENKESLYQEFLKSQKLESILESPENLPVLIRTAKIYSRAIRKAIQGYKTHPGFIKRTTQKFFGTENRLENQLVKNPILQNEKSIVDIIFNNYKLIKEISDIDNRY